MSFIISFFPKKALIIFAENRIGPGSQRLFLSLRRKIALELHSCFLTDIVEYQNSVKTGKNIVLIEIDLLGLDGKNYVLAGECKFKTEKFDNGDLDNFLNKVNYLPASNLKIMLFSLSGFTDSVIGNSKNLTLVTLAEMY